MPARDRHHERALGAADCRSWRRRSPSGSTLRLPSALTATIAIAGSAPARSALPVTLMTQTLPPSLPVGRPLQFGAERRAPRSSARPSTGSASPSSHRCRSRWASGERAAIAAGQREHERDRQHADAIRALIAVLHRRRFSPPPSATTCSTKYRCTRGSPVSSGWNVGRQQVALPRGHDVPVVRGEHLDALADRLDPRRADEDAAERLVEAVEVEVGLEAVDLAAVGVAAHRDVHQAERLAGPAAPSTIVLRDQDRAGARAPDGHALRRACARIGS